MDFYHCKGPGEGLIQLRPIIPKLVNLEHLSWHGPTNPEDFGLFGDFQLSCPKLRSLALDGVGGDATTEDQAKIFSFRNLMHIEIKRWHLGTASDGPPNVVPTPLFNMIRSSPGLTTLKLLHWPAPETFQNRSEINQLFETIDVAFPRLRHFEFHITSSRLDWGSLFDTARGNNHIQSFFQNHPYIETLVVNWLPMDRLRANSRVIQRMFPALRHLTGPESLCAIIANSGLQLLEGLTIVVPIDIDRNKVVKLATKLPQLHHLRFRVEAGDKARRQQCEDTLQKYLRAAPNLVSLEIRDIYMSTRWDVSLASFVCVIICPHHR
ncbi:hypothetical protein FRC08_000302 [Ceratobasidium sp. 394]|nr:hypothetical protein FRC08_000302 [Ceratobasidium sp. 394]